MPPQTRPRTNPPAATREPPPWVAGQQWAQLRLRQPGWIILPLRAFLGVTFVYAGLQKLANPTYLNPANPASVVGQMHLLRHVSPIGPLLGLSMHAPTAVGLLIAFGELAVGVGALLGLWTRLAAAGGMALALTFLLTVSWRTTPYYYGSDVVFFFAWTVIAAFGAGNVVSLDGWLRQRARARAGLRPLPATVSLEVPRLREICARKDACGLRPTGACSREQCGIFPAGERLRPPVAAELDRHHAVLGRRAVVVTGLAALATGGIVAWLGRLVGGTSTASAAPRLRPTPRRTPAPGPASPTGTAATSPPPGTAIGKASQVPVGHAGQFTDPASGAPGWVVHPSGDTFVAFSAVCTHAGCTVQYDGGSMHFVCPCHGGTFDARTGEVLGGPPPSPLARIPVHVVNGEIRVD
ncbi:MAG: thiosulfate dehydrogenase (quinone) large subunit [Frankiaceae bacterium]|jgi:thiosulfate dehydrogenase [quinone] large subunit|nr:thiosulfate dehydrogenase (quinone) large subunit [Frankiaceae bacterium]